MASNDRSRDSQFVKVNFWVMNSVAWTTLSPNARALFLEMKKRFNGYNNGKIGFGVREAGPSINIHYKTVGKYFSELQEKGFIVATYAASFENSKGKRATEWEITDEPAAPDNNAKKLFMRWKTPKDNFPVIRSPNNNACKKHSPQKRD